MEDELLTVADLDMLPGFRTFITRNRGRSFRSEKNSGFFCKSAGETLVSCKSTKLNPQSLVALM